jgi:hypothetical protein
MHRKRAADRRKTPRSVYLVYDCLRERASLYSMG